MADRLSNLLLGFTMVLLVVVVSLWTSADSISTAKPSHCGVERWAVKTLADPDAQQILKAPVQETTIHDLVAHQAPDKASLVAASKTRFPAERMKVRVKALVFGWKKEADSDIHIELADPSSPTTTMIAEIPSDACVPAEFSSQFASLQARFAKEFGKPTPAFKRIKPVAATFTGIVFFDPIHGQTGVAPNGIELHPVLDWTK